MPFDNIIVWIIAQVVLDAALVALVFVFLTRLHRQGQHQAGIPDEVSGAMERFLKESDRLARTLDATLAQKREISVNLILKIERKITEMNALLERAETRLASARKPDEPPPGEPEKANPAAPEIRTLVVRLSAQGRSVEEIARMARLHRGEVELILDLERQLTT